MGMNRLQVYHNQVCKLPVKTTTATSLNLKRAGGSGQFLCHHGILLWSKEANNSTNGSRANLLYTVSLDKDLKAPAQLD